MTQLGTYVKRRRDQMGWSRAELARVADVPYSTLSNIELSKKNVKPTEVTLKKVAAAFKEDDSQLRILAGYDIVQSVDVSERAKRIDALLTVAPRWGTALLAIEEMSEEEQNQALTALEVHVELVRRRHRRS